MTNDRAFERAEAQLSEDLANGVYTLAEFNERMHDLGREYRDAVEEEAQEAYDNVMYRRGGYPMSEMTRQQEEEMADRLLDSQIADYEEERWQRRHAARWPTDMEYGVYLDRVEPPPEAADEPFGFLL